MTFITPLHVYRKELETLLDGEIERLKDNLSLGLIETHDEYKHLAGKIAGLRLAQEYMLEADRLCKEKVF